MPASTTLWTSNGPGSWHLPRPGMPLRWSNPESGSNRAHLSRCTSSVSQNNFVVKELMEFFRNFFVYLSKFRHFPWFLKFFEIFGPFFQTPWVPCVPRSCTDCSGTSTGCLCWTWSSVNIPPARLSSRARTSWCSRSAAVALPPPHCSPSTPMAKNLRSHFWWFIFRTKEVLKFKWSLVLDHYPAGQLS